MYVVTRKSLSTNAILLFPTDLSHPVVQLSDSDGDGHESHTASDMPGRSTDAVQEEIVCYGGNILQC